MNLPGIDEANHVARVNSGQRNRLFQGNDLHVCIAPISVADGPVLALYVKRIGFVAFRGYQNFLGVCHFLIYYRREPKRFVPSLRFHKNR